MRLVWLGLFIAGVCSAHDEQLSVYYSYPHPDVESVDVGFAFDTVLGQRTVVGASMAISAPSASGNRHLTAAVRSRLLLQPHLATQWYPNLLLQSDLSQRVARTYLGVGVQHKLFDALAIYSELDWQLRDYRNQIRLGLRFWPNQLRSLDARITAAKPLGPIYQPGGRPTTARAAELSFEPLSATPPTMQQALPEPPQVATAASAQQASPQPASTTAIRSGLYLNLGVFKLQESLLELDADPRLQRHRPRLQRWFDKRLDAYRLLLGPLSAAEATIIGTQLKQQQLDSFQIHIDNRSH